METEQVRPELYIWAKAGDGVWSPLWLHLFDTMAVFEVLWDQWCPPTIKSQLSTELSLTEKETGLLMQTLFGLHDLGKASPDFGGREKLVKFAAAEQYQQMVEHGFRFNQLLSVRRGSEIRHERLSASFLAQLLDLPAGSRNDPARSLLAPIAMHHGPSHEEAAVFSRKQTSLDSVLQSDPTWSKAVQATLNLVVDRQDAKCGANVKALVRAASEKGLSNRGQLALGGLMRMADWLASSEDFFPLVELGEVPSPEDEDFLAERYEGLSAEALGLVRQSSPASPAFEPPAIFTKGFELNAPNAVQQEFWQVVQTADPANLFILEAPMGQGKTEAALVAAKILEAKSGSSGFFFGLPTRATSDAIYTRVHSFLQNLGSASPTTLALHHGAAQYSKTYRGNQHEARRKRRQDLQDEALLVDEGWLHSANRRILNEHVVGTIDAFLMLGLKHKNAYWKHLGFSAKVIILDEVHAADEYMAEYLCRALEWAAYYGRPVIMLSATLTSKQRELYLAAYARGKAS